MAALITLLAVILAGFSSVASAAADERLALLTAAEQAIANRMTAFIARVQEKHAARVAELNGGIQFETLERETDDSHYFVRVARGPVVEKIGMKVVVGKKQQPGRKPEGLRWGRFFLIDVHPETPLAGMLHSTIVLQFYEDGTSAVGGWLGVMNGTRNAGDMAVLRNLTDAHFAKYGRDPAPYRRLIMKGTEDTVAEFRRKPDDSGVSFYGPPVFPGDTARSFQFVSELYEQFTTAYLELVAKRSSDPYTAADLAAQDAMRKRWLIDQLYSDPFASKLVPFEVWWFSNLPPEVKF
jgi:coproporphyrinogen III oxidase